MMTIGIDYGSKKSVAVLMEQHDDGSWTVHEIVDGKGLTEVFGGTSAGQESDGGSDGSLTVA